MKVLVLGATGMLGGYTALALKKAGHEVVAASRRDSDNGFFADHGIPYLGGWNLTDPRTFAILPQDVGAVVHMAGYMPAHGDASAMPYVKSIVEGTVNVAEWMVNETACRRIVFNTTPADLAAHYPAGKPVDDDAPRSFPKNGGDHAVYAICKAAATDILENYSITSGLKPCVFRHFTVFGWHPNAAFNINGRETVSPWRQVWRRAIAGEDVEVWGAPDHQVELLYVDDFTDAVEKAIRCDACGLFNLPGFKPYTLDEEFQALIDVFSTGSRKSVKRLCPEKPVGPTALLKGDKAERLLGWKARVDWRSACEKMRAAAIENPFVKIWGPADSRDLPLI